MTWLGGIGASFGIASAVLGLGQQVQTPTSPPMVPVFTDAEKTRVLAFWNEPNRYVVSVPTDAKTKGLFVVRLTAEGSTWLLKAARQIGLPKLPPTANVMSGGSDTSAWTTWIQQKIAWDGFQAQQEADADNLNLFGVPIPPQMPTAPENPGPCPSALALVAGDPPAFAHAVIPKQFTVNFDDFHVTYQDHVGVRKNYAYYRFDDGVDFEGTALNTLSPTELDELFRMAHVSPSMEKVMAAVSSLEGGFDAINTYDTGYVSVGFIQFASLAEGGGSLGAMMLQYKTADPTDFFNDFTEYGIDVTPQGIMAVIDPVTGVEVQGPDTNREIIEDKRLIGVFQRAGTVSKPFEAAQIASALTQFDPRPDSFPIMIDGQDETVTVGDIIHSEAGLATMMDRKVNTGSLKALPAVLQAVADEHHLRHAADLAKYEREIVMKMKYRRDYLADFNLTQPK